MSTFIHRALMGASLTTLLAASSYAKDTYPEDEIIVTGSPLVRSIDEAITGLSVLTGDELQERLASTIGETLKTEPGVSSTFFGAGASRPIIRGQGGDRVRVLTNGVGSIDASSSSPDHAVAAETAQAERIEVLRGASLLRYGSSGSGGIVNVIDGRIPTEQPEGGFDGAARVGASSVDEGVEASGSFDFGLGNFVAHIDGSYKETQDYDIPGFAESAAFRALEEAEEEEHDDDDDLVDGHHEEEEEAFGTLENSATETTSFTGGLSYIGERGFLGFAVHKFDSNYGLPGGHEEAGGHEEEEEEDDDDLDGDEHDEEEEEEEEVTIDLDQIRVDVNGALDIEGQILSRIQVFGGFADYEHVEFEGPGEVGTVFTNKGYEGRIEAIQVERDNWSGAFGLHYRTRDFSAIGEEAFVPETDTEQVAIYTFQEVDLGIVHLDGAARFEDTSVENTEDDIRRSFNLFSVSAGGDIHLTESFRLGGTVFRTERAPTAEELFSDGPHLATDQFEIGDVNLDKETATGAELSLRYRNDRYFLTANAFYTDYDDYIFEQETGEIAIEEDEEFIFVTDTDEDGLPVFEFVGEDSSFKGFEVQGGAQLTRFKGFDISADALAEYVRAKSTSGDLPRIPPFGVLAGIEADSEAFNLRAEIDYLAEQNKVETFELPTDSSTQVNLFGTWRPNVTGQDVSVRVSVLNLFDEDVRQHASFLKDEVPLPGRNFRVSVATRF